MGEIIRNGSTIENGPLEASKLQPLFKQDSVKKKYLYKLFTNFFGLGINLVTQAIIPRGLGPKAYGDFNFLTNFFTQVVGFLDMGTSTAFYTKLSRRPQESSLVSFYLYFTVLVSLGAFGFVFLSIVTSVYTKLWPTQDIFYIYLAVGWGIVNWIVTVLNKVADACGVTISAELARVFQKVVGLVLIIFLYAFSQLNLTTFFYYQFFLYSVLGLLFVWIVRQYFSLQNRLLSMEQIRKYSREFYHYSHPLFIYSLVGLIVGLLDRWLLQIYAGSVQQGFYSLSYQIGALCFIFTSAMTPLFIRELSIAFGKSDFAKMAELFHRFIPLFYSIAAFFSCFIAVQADKVVYIFGGSKYEGAATTIAIMAFYPLHQTYGQLSGSVFLATEQTHSFRNIGLVMMIIGLPVTYFMIAPRALWGLGIGANGLAIKMVLINITWVNVQLYFNSRYLQFSFRKYLGLQFMSVACLLTIAFFTSYIVNKPLGLGKSFLLSFLLAGVLYTLVVLCLVYCVPAVFGVRRHEIQSMVRFLRDKLIAKYENLI